MADQRREEWEQFLSDPRTVRRGDQWFSRAHPPDVASPPVRTRLQVATEWLEARGVAVEVSALGDEYLVDLVREDGGHHLLSAATGRTPEEAVEAAVHWWQRRSPSG